jgi:hypothetical protein
MRYKVDEFPEDFMETEIATGVILLSPLQFLILA